MSPSVPKSNISSIKYADALRGVRHVFVRDLMIRGFIGVYDHEKINKQQMCVNIDSVSYTHLTLPTTPYV